MTIGMEVMKFIVNNLDLTNAGQGNFCMTCNKLWDMSDEEFKEKFPISDAGGKNE